MISLDTIFDTRVFHIPENQRGYSWTEKEIDELFGDLEIMGAKCHYLGTIICSKIETFLDDKTKRPTVKYILEDGQQRLTTFLIILNEIKKRFEHLDQGVTVESTKLEQLVTYKRGSTGLRIENKNQALHECLSHYLLGVPVLLPADKSPPMRFLERAVKYIEGRVNLIETREDLLELRNKVCHQVQIIEVDLADAMVDRYLTFDAINSRGLPLTEFDKIKNFCMLVCERRKLKIEPNINWYDAITNLEKFGVASRGNENAFIAELYSIFHGVNTGNSDVHDAFVKEYRILLEGENKLKENQIVSFIGYWVEYSHAWGLISSKKKTNYYGTEVTKISGRWLDAIDNLGLPAVTRKLLSASLMNAVSSKSLEGFDEIARACEVYTFRMHGICRYRVDKNSKAILEISNQVLKNQKGSDFVLQELSKLLNEGAKLADCIKNLISGDINYRNWRPYLYYMLYEYELSESSAGVKPLNWASSEEEKDNTIEHILPREHRDGAWWEQHWPDQSVAEKYVDRIGNLVLTQGNSVLGRKPIKEKLDGPHASYYYNYPKATNSEKKIKNYTDGSVWKERNILERELDIARFVGVRWSLPSATDSGNIELAEVFKQHVPNCSLEFQFHSAIDVVVEDSPAVEFY